MKFGASRLKAPQLKTVSRPERSSCIQRAECPNSSQTSAPTPTVSSEMRTSAPDAFSAPRESGETAGAG